MNQLDAARFLGMGTTSIKTVVRRCRRRCCCHCELPCALDLLRCCFCQTPNLRCRVPCGCCVAALKRGAGQKGWVALR